MMRVEIAASQNIAPNPAQTKKVSKATTVLEELFVLLEEYGPTWYTQEHHDRAVKALLDRED